MSLSDDNTRSGALGGPRDRLLPWPKIHDITGLSRATAWRRQRAGDFPASVQISPGRVAWRESEIQRWLESREPRTRATELPAFIAGKNPEAAAQVEQPTKGSALSGPNHISRPARRRRSDANDKTTSQIGFDFG